MKMPESPQCGDFVRVRTRRWLVEGEGSAGDGLTTLRLACVDDDAQGETVEVLWDAELDGSVLREGLLSRNSEPMTQAFSQHICARSVGILRPLQIVIYSRPHSEQASTRMPTSFFH
jgi:hypothetical protein